VSHSLGSISKKQIKSLSRFDDLLKTKKHLSRFDFLFLKKQKKKNNFGYDMNPRPQHIELPSTIKLHMHLFVEVGPWFVLLIFRNLVIGGGAL
jgi:hypothetical protein